VINPKPVLLLNHFTRPVRRTEADVSEELITKKHYDNIR
jgi:hypothetical protein